VPLALNEKKLSTIALGPIYVFFVVGLWHGANWTYVIWGTLHGVYLAVERLLLPVSNFLAKKLGTIFIKLLGFILFFNAFTFANIFFRARSVAEAVFLMEQIFTVPGTNLNPGLHPFEFQLLWMVLGGSVLFEYSRRKWPAIDLLNFQQTWLRWTVYIVLGLMVWFLRIPEDVQFIYFEF